MRAKRAKGGRNGNIVICLARTCLRRYSPKSPLSKIAIVQGIVGGKVVFLEYEKERPQLRKLYTQKYGFREFPMPSNEDKQRKLGQLFCFLNDDVERNEPKVD